MRAEGIRRGADHVRQFTILGDGAAWIWNIASSKFPAATQIVDLFHAREHLHDLARLLEFMLLDQKDEWLAARLENLDYGDIDGICTAARAYPLEGIKKTSSPRPWATSRTSAPDALPLVPLPRPVRRIRCRRGRLQNGHRAALQIVRHALDRRGANAITTLRCQQASRPEDQIWHTPRNQPSP